MAMNMLNSHKKSNVKDVKLSAPSESYRPKLHHKSASSSRATNHMGRKMYQKYYKGTIFLRVSKAVGAKVDALEEIMGYRNQADVVNKLINEHREKMSPSQLQNLRFLYNLKLKHFKK